MSESLSIAAAIAYVPIKMLAYAFVARLGIETFQPSVSKAWWRSIAVAVARGLIGVAMAVPLLWAGEWLQSQHWESQPAFVLVAYLAFYLPLRWVAWSLVAPLVNPKARSLRAVALCASGLDALWRGVGVFASCMIDLILVLVTGTVPIGKFFC